MLFQNRRLRSAFTLVELMVVLVILAMLSSVVTVSIRTYLIKSKQSVAKIEISKMYKRRTRILRPSIGIPPIPRD